jgi:phage tail-like protein
MDDDSVAGFRECSGLDADIQRMNYREGTDPNSTLRKLRGLTNYTDVILRRGYTKNRKLWEWWSKINTGTAMERRDIVIELQNENRERVLSWKLKDAWICTWKGPTLNATTNEVAIEEIVLSHEGLELE